MIETMQDLYDGMKEALKFFGLSFGDKDEIQVSINGHRIVFAYEGKELRLPLNLS